MGMTYSINSIYRSTCFFQKWKTISAISQFPANRISHFDCILLMTYLVQTNSGWRGMNGGQRGVVLLWFVIVTSSNNWFSHSPSVFFSLQRQRPKRSKWLCSGPCSPGISDPCAEEQMARIMTMILQVRSVLVPNTWNPIAWHRGNEYGEYLIHCSDGDVTSVLLT